jgi:NitT/TauT family transport system substrate-binding protein
MKRGDLDGSIMDVANAFRLENLKEGRILVRFDHIKDFHIHVTYATNKAIAEKPQAIRNFLAGWIETIKFMRANKAETVKIAMDVMHKTEETSSRTYDEVMPMFSETGKFDDKALALLKKAWVELKLLPSAPDVTKMYTEEYLPK